MNIGVLDSGVGGFSVLAVLERNFPDQQFIYLRDTKNFPYSEKSPAQLIEIAHQNAEVLIAQYCQIIVIACNTLTVTTLAYLRQTFPTTTFIGTVPAVKPAAELLPPHSHIAVLATKNTAESQYLQDLIHPWKTQHTWTLLGTTQLVQNIENWDNSAITTELEKLLLPVAHKLPLSGIVLGCTHFPFVETQILQALQSQPELIRGNLQFFEPSMGISRQLRIALDRRNELAKNTPQATLFFDTTQTSFTESSAQTAALYTSLTQQKL